MVRNDEISNSTAGISRKQSTTSKLFAGLKDNLKLPIPVHDTHTKAPQLLEDLDPLEVQGIEKLGEYKVKRILGHGASAEVREVVHIQTGIHYAMKCIKKSGIPGFSKSLSRGKVLREMTILQNIKHPNIVEVHDSFQDDQMYYLILELCNGGVIFDRIHGIVNPARGSTRSAGFTRVTEKDVAEVVRLKNCFSI
ncbi:Calcium-dependent protein kinase 4 [Nowakowskiella sp. JEL0078]|nr:Calcium-dependent protein kinase 4 [Nowakowskiella sp. JEL0078]